MPLAEALAHPLVLRERGSGTLEVLEFALRELGIRPGSLPVALYFDNTEAIKTYLEAAPEALGFVSRRELAWELASGYLETVAIASLHLPRQFDAVWVQRQPLPRSVQHFLRFAHGHFTAAWRSLCGPRQARVAKLKLRWLANQSRCVSQ